MEQLIYIVLGAVLGFAFRGLIAREVSSLKAHISAEVDKLKSKV